MAPVAKPTQSLPEKLSVEVEALCPRPCFSLIGGCNWSCSWIVSSSTFEVYGRTWSKKLDIRGSQTSLAPAIANRLRGNLTVKKGVGR